jgi:hypothetical protein
VSDPLHRRRIDLEPGGNATDALAGLQSGNDSVFKVGGYPGPAKLFALSLGSLKPGADSFLDH